MSFFQGSPCKYVVTATFYYFRKKIPKSAGTVQDSTLLTVFDELMSIDNKSFPAFTSSGVGISSRRKSSDALETTGSFRMHDTATILP
ncbi:hypothetical protein M378DRAFT_163520 [Amanita muscaria Koide BX008]|uniref:Uncharacterized protein n=1 Tax=Amanita muscaria (strain Koide BX008) TaxID=946122 RepID=A0A0C2SM31_AMAMK|nr:hypothetical protein M378DRAFT_163520 [Amanita muscaria Koide BX008]